MQTDYIGRIEDDYIRPIGTGKRLRKVIRDESNTTIEMAVWPKESSMLPTHINKGDIIAIARAMVTLYETTLQLESTPATTIEINPSKPETIPHFNRLRALPPPNLITIKELTAKANEDKPSNARYNCLAEVRSIRTDRIWYYVLCSICNSKMHIKRGPPCKYLCEDDKETITKLSR